MGAVEINMQTTMSSDKDELFICPYDPVHRVAARRYIRHIIKCRRNFPLVEKAVCPFNARHVVPKPELRHHLSCCPDARMIESEINFDRCGYDGDEVKGDTSMPPMQSQPLDFGSEENWDDEIADNASTQEYVYGLSGPKKTVNRRREEIKRIKEEMRRKAQEESNFIEAHFEIHQRRPMRHPGVADRQNLMQYGLFFADDPNPAKPLLAANFQKPVLSD
ncbi:uncharacterized protein LOC120339828 [Styela clava]